MSGVEIGATAFANLLEDRTLHPLPPLWHCLVVLGWAALLGGGLTRVSTGLVIPGGLALAAGYTAIAYYAFARHDLWIPLAVPPVQAPLATVAALFWGFRDTRKERDTIHEGIGHYLPDFVVENIIRERGELPMEVHGICLYTDAERYTALSERLPPAQLREFLNRYYEALFEPIGRHGGFVSDVVGDAMLALWATADADPRYRGEACRAVLARKSAPLSDSMLLPQFAGSHACLKYLWKLEYGQGLTCATCHASPGSTVCNRYAG